MRGVIWIGGVDNNLTERLAYRFSSYIKMKSPGSRSVEVINYGMIIIFNLLFTIFISFVLAVLFGVLKQVIIVFVSFVLIRQFAGGYHLKSSDTCVIVSTFLLLFIPYVNSHIYQTDVYSQIISILVMLLFAPLSKKISYKKSPIRYIIYKIIPVALIGFNIFIIKSSLISLTFLAASASLTLAYCSHIIKLRRQL